MDVAEIVPSVDNFDVSNFAVKGDRADGQRIVLGDTTCQKLAEGKLFMIGTDSTILSFFSNLRLRCYRL